jgi:hypothetical protein
MMLYVEWCDPGCKQVGLKSCVVSIDYRDYMGSSSKIWALRCLFLYLCSYNLVGSVIEATSSREAPWYIQCRHPPQTMIGDINQRVTWSRSYHISYFTHSAFVASFEPRDIGHALSNADWVNVMHEELENFEWNQVWVLVLPPPDCHPIGTKWVYKNK